MDCRQTRGCDPLAIVLTAAASAPGHLVRNTFDSCRTDAIEGHELSSPRELVSGTARAASFFRDFEGTQILRLS